VGDYNRSDESVDQLAIHMQSVTINVQVWYQPGEADPVYSDAYKQAFTGIVTGQGHGVPTLLPPFATPVEIPPNSSHAFYTSGAVDSLSVYYTGGGLHCSTFASASDIT